MNDIINRLLLVGDKFMLKMRLRQPGFTYSAFGKRKKEYKSLNKLEIQDIFTKMN